MKIMIKEDGYYVPVSSLEYGQLFVYLNTVYVKVTSPGSRDVVVIDLALRKSLSLVWTTNVRTVNILEATI